MANISSAADSEWDLFPDDDIDDEDPEHGIHDNVSSHGLSGPAPLQLVHQPSCVEKEVRILMKSAASTAVLHLTQHFCKTFHVPLQTCRVAIFGATSFVDREECSNDKSCPTLDVLWFFYWKEALKQRNVLAISHLKGTDDTTTHDDFRKSTGESESVARSVDAVGELFDVIVAPSDYSTGVAVLIDRHLVPGGLLLLTTSSRTPYCTDPMYDRSRWTPPSNIFSGQSNADLSKIFSIKCWSKLLCPINTESCRLWLPSKHSLSTEQINLQHSTVVLSATQCNSLHQMRQKQSSSQLQSYERSLWLSPAQLQKAITALSSHGYCVLPKLLDPNICVRWGQAVLHDLSLADSILQDKYHVDVYQPQTNPDSYKELSMREDLRMDLRDGPQLRQRNQRDCHLFWNSSDLVYIVQRVMYPRREEFRHGNFGRYNFDGITRDEDGNSEDDSYPAIKVSPIGGIISLPGAAEQALHADTPHLFEHEDCLPAHYINAFTLGSYLADFRVGGTALIHNSHCLSFTAKYTPTTSYWTTSLKEEMFSKYLVRPWLEPGDVLLFDCRILHFGLANGGKEVRPMLYSNLSHSWFHDPKNWQDRQAIFDSEHFTLQENEDDKGEARFHH